MGKMFARSLRVSNTIFPLAQSAAGPSASYFPLTFLLILPRTHFLPPSVSSPLHCARHTGQQLLSDRVVSSKNDSHGAHLSKRRNKGNAAFRRFVRKDGLTKGRAEKLDKQFARSILRSSMSFSAFHSDDWYKCFYLMRPSYKPPSATSTAGLLDNEHKALMSKSRHTMLQWTSMTIIIGTTHQSEKNVMNAFLCWPMPFFIEHLKQNIRKAGRIFTRS